MTKGYAFFDLDHTLLPFDTQALFCNYVLRHQGWRRVWLLWFLPFVPLAGLRVLSLRTMKRLYLGYLIGMKRETLGAYVRDFLETDFKAALHPSVVAEVDRHSSEDRVVVLNSASPDFYLHGVGDLLDVDHVVGTKVELSDRMPWMPVILGPNNKEGEKIMAMRALEIIPEVDGPFPDSWSYSDSSADLPLLRLAEHPIMVHPSARLAEVGDALGWKTLRPPLPYRGRWGRIWASCLQTMGLYRVPPQSEWHES